ncbi:MAG: 3-oxoadipate enol-lactonase, partial [Gaiellales bacterium]
MNACGVHHVLDGPASGAPVVLSNSLGTTMRMWDPQAAALARTRLVLRYDTRGHGHSPVPPPPYDLPDLGRDVIALLDWHDIERASLCGVSLGGMVSMWLAAHAPERVERLLLCSTSALFGPPELWAERAALVRGAGMEAVADAVIERWFTPAFAAARPGVVAATRAELVATPAEGYAACCGVVERMDLRADLPAIQAPTLVIAARDDPSTPPEHAHLIADGIPGARLVVLERGAHLVNIETPDVVTELVLGHLRAEGKGEA